MLFGPSADGTLRMLAVRSAAAPSKTKPRTGWEIHGMGV